jgi:hypothetical protein
MVCSFVLAKLEVEPLKVKNSFALANKLIVFIDTEVNPSPSLRALIRDEQKKYKQGFSGVVVMGAKNSIVTYRTA